MDAELAQLQGDEEAGSEFFRANLEAFKEHAPYLHKRLMGITEPHSSLLIDPDGSVDMALLGKRFYDCDARRHTDEQIKAYFESPHRFALAEPDPERLEGSNAAYCDRMKEGMRDLGVEYDLKHCPDGAHFLIVFGIGLGFHVETLIERSEARVICLIEPNLECLYYSLQVTDWTRIFDLAEDGDRILSIIVERSPKRIGRKMQSVMRTNQPTFVDGIYLYTHYRSTVLQQSLDHLRDNLPFTLAGLGFFEDEVIMTTNAVANMAGRDLAMLCGPHPPKDVPVFVVGSGPSVAQDLDFVVANRDRAMVFSIGTGIRILRNRGVIPDFHFEIENGTHNANLMGATHQEFDLSGVTLIASITVRPRMLSYFKNVYLFFREELSATKNFAGELSILQPAGPTVANTAIAAGLRMGFREYYLFGVDMGTRTEGKFHAEESVYALGKFEDPSAQENCFPANFGGKVFGERVLNWSRTTLEMVLNTHRDLTVYNCSDGARIAGSIPIVSRAVRLPDQPVDRDAVKREIASYVSLITAERTAGMWCREARQEELACFLDQVEAHLLPVPEDSDPTDDWLLAIAREVWETGKISPIVTSYLSGSLLIMLGVTRWYDRRVADPSGRARFRRYAAVELLEAVRFLRARLTELYDHVDAQFAAADQAGGREWQSEAELLAAER